MSASASIRIAEAIRAAPRRPAWASAFFAGNALRIPNTSAACSAEVTPGAVQAKELAVVAVEDAHHHQGMRVACHQHPVQHGERLGRLARVHGIGEVPRGEGARLAEEGPEVLSRDGRPTAVGGRQGVEEALEAAHVPAQVVREDGGGPPVEAHRTPLQMLGQPLRPGLPRADGGVHHFTGGGDRLDQSRRHRPTPTHQDEHGRDQRIPQVGHQPLGVGSGQLAGLPHHHHPALDQERRRGAGVDHQADVELVDARPTELLDHQGRVTASHQSGGKGMDGLAHQTRVVAPHQVDRPGGSRRFAATASPPAGDPRARSPSERRPWSARR